MEEGRQQEVHVHRPAGLADRVTPCWKIQEDSQEHHDQFNGRSGSRQRKKGNRFHHKVFTVMGFIVVLTILRVEGMRTHKKQNFVADLSNFKGLQCVLGSFYLKNPAYGLAWLLCAEA